MTADECNRTPLRVLSNLCLVGGVLLLLTPLVWAAYTSRAAADVQTVALAEWESAVVPVALRGSAPVAPSGFLLTVPRLGLRRFVPDGATAEHLRRYGLGRISWTALPDTDGIVGIAGHRTTYGAPFLQLHRLRVGDIIRVDYSGRRYVYTVLTARVVRPEEVDVFDDPPGHRGIALVACTPIYSAAFRLVVLGRLLEVSSALSQ